MKHFLTFEDIGGESLPELLALAARLKRGRGSDTERPLAGKCLGLVFSKSSTRTRVSFEVGITELGGTAMFLNANELQLGRGETVADTARVLSRYLHGVVIRTFKHGDVVEFAKHASIPVVNALTSEYHPCQAFSDIFTIHERMGRLKGVKLVFLGDGRSNMANSLVLTAKYTGLDVVVCSPPDFSPGPEILARGSGNGVVSVEHDPVKAMDGADFIYTDVWVSMGYEDEKERRVKVLSPYQVNAALLSHAPAHAKVLHCLPACRGMEITDEVADGPQSIIFDQAENRLHAQKALLVALFKGR